MLTFKEQLAVESIVDPIQPSLSSQVFEDPTSDLPKLRPEVIQQIESGISKIKAHAEVVDCALIGSILTRRYTKTSDLDVTVLVNAPKDSLKPLMSGFPSLNGIMAPGTQHPINYFIVYNRQDYDRKLSLADGVFDIKSNSFKRKPIFKRFDVRKYIQQFKSITNKIDVATNKLLIDLFSYEELKYATKAELKYLRMSLLEKLEDDVLELSDIYKKIKTERRAAFERPLTAKDIKMYGDKNRLPENVIYKLLEKYHYLDFLHKVDSILGDDKELSADDANQLVALFTKL